MELNNSSRISSEFLMDLQFFKVSLMESIISERIDGFNCDDLFENYKRIILVSLGL